MQFEVVEHHRCGERRLEATRIRSASCAESAVSATATSDSAASRRDGQDEISAAIEIFSLGYRRNAKEMFHCEGGSRPLTLSLAQRLGMAAAGACAAVQFTSCGRVAGRQQGTCISTVIALALMPFSFVAAAFGFWRRLPLVVLPLSRL